MITIPLSITPPDTEEQKGRTFRATILGYATGTALFPAGRASVNEERPIFMTLAGSENELQPVIASLQMGTTAETLSGGGRRDKTTYHFLKSIGYEWIWQRTKAGSTCTIFLPQLFRSDPGMVDPAGCAFAILAPQTWVDQQRWDMSDAISHLAAYRRHIGDDDTTLKDSQMSWFVPMSALFAAYIDRRTRCPLIADARFYVQFCYAALAPGKIASLSAPSGSGRFEWGKNGHVGYTEHAIESSGMAPGIACACNHAALDELLAEQIKIYFRLVKKG